MKGGAWLVLAVSALMGLGLTTVSYTHLRAHET